MEWTDEAIVLSARRHGETSAIVTLITPHHGVHAALARGGAGKRGQGLYQPGNRVCAHWRGRLAEHLGTLTSEMVTATAAALLDCPLKLAALSAACAVCEQALPERQPHGPVFDGLSALLAVIGNANGGGNWPSAYVKWELGVLAELGFGLDLGSCAATGVVENLTYVSPRSGRAVSDEAAQPYRERLLALPAFLLYRGAAGDHREVTAGLKLTGYFLEKCVFSHYSRSLPPARIRLAERWRGETGKEELHNNTTV
ncbi:MAG TPA: DNA repair protein RecO [Alphaproteobacteria bacterium]|nr:DNA repair protein RecO [Alphaproteobacteria bacterium]